MATNTQQTTSAGDTSGGSKINAFQAFAHLPRTLKVAVARSCVTRGFSSFPKRFSSAASPSFWPR